MHRMNIFYIVQFKSENIILQTFGKVEMNTCIT